MNTLPALPAELHSMIISNTNWRDLFHCSQVCKSLHETLQNKDVWGATVPRFLTNKYNRLLAEKEESVKLHINVEYEKIIKNYRRPPEEFQRLMKEKKLNRAKILFVIFSKNVEEIFKNRDSFFSLSKMSLEITIISTTLNSRTSNAENSDFDSKESSDVLFFNLDGTINGGVKLNWSIEIKEGRLFFTNAINGSFRDHLERYPIYDNLEDLVQKIEELRKSSLQPEQPQIEAFTNQAEAVVDRFVNYFKNLFADDEG